MRGHVGFWMALLVGGLSVGMAGAEPYRDASGYSMEPPTGWAVLNKVNSSQLAKPVRDWVAKSRVDLSRVSVVFVKQSFLSFAENMNVVVDHQQMPINGQSARKLLEILPGQLQMVGVTPKNFRVSTRKYGPHETIVVEFESKNPLMPQPIAQKQVYFAGQGKTYIVTCTALANSFSQVDPVFERTLASMQIQSPGAAAVGNKSTTGTIPGKTVASLPTMPQIKFPFPLQTENGQQSANTLQQILTSNQENGGPEFGNGSGNPQADALRLLADSGAFRLDDWNNPMARYTWLFGLGALATIVKSLVAIFKH